ncbi:MAG: acyl-CoA dehydrogenase family protein [Actinomycetota bacterium]|nr:acyl-CoA dehydrogenase family protein [Actinomycetota bacterium]
MTGTGGAGAGSVDHEMILERCRKLVPALAERAAEGERLRRLPDATIADAHAADLFRTVLPTADGGHGLGLSTLGHLTRILSKGDASAGWTLSFLVLHNWLLQKFGPGTRGDLFGDGNPVLAPAPLAPTGVAVPVDGGYRLGGRWEWATGVMHADWVMVHAIVQRDAAEPELRYGVVPVGDVTIDDVWHTSGMRATGSNTVVLDDVFVPEHRTALSSVLRGAPEQVTGDPDVDFAVYPTVPVLALVASSVALGAAERVVELFRERMAVRVLAYSMGDRQADQPLAQSRLASALATVRSTRAMWEAALADVDRTCSSPAGPLPTDRAAARLAAAHTVRLSREVIAQVCEGSGASVYAEDSPLQRFQRDVEVLKGHVIFDWDRTTELVGRIELGAEPRPTDLL